MRLTDLAKKNGTTVNAQATKLGFQNKASLYVRMDIGWTAEESFFTPINEKPPRILAQRAEALLRKERAIQKLKDARARRKEIRRRKKAILVNGEYLSPDVAAERCGITRQAAYMRIKRGWTRQNAFTTPKQSQGNPKL